MLTDRKVTLDLEERQVGELLIGRAVGITVSEPWDFEYPDDARIITGYVSDVGADARGEARAQWAVVTLTKTLHPETTTPGAKVERVKATRRHEDPHGLLEQLLAGGRVTANFSYADQVPPESVDPRNHPGFIGTLALESVWSKEITART